MPWIPEEQIGYDFVGEKFILAGDTISLSKYFIGKINIMELTTEVTLPENRERLPCFVLDARDARRFLYCNVKLSWK